MPLQGVVYQECLGTEGIDGIDHEVVVCRVKQRLCFLVADEAVANLYLQVGVDVSQPCRHHLCLGLAQRGVQRGELAVEVAEADDIGIDQRHPPHTGTGYLFGSVGAYSAEADHQDVAGCQPPHPLCPQKEGGACCPIVIHCY